MKTILLSIALFSFAASAAQNQTWKNVDNELNTGAKKAKGQFVDKKNPPKKDKSGTVTGGLNNAWNSVLGGVGDVIGTQQEKKPRAKK